MTQQSDSEITWRVVLAWGEHLRRTALEVLPINVPLPRTRAYLSTVGLPQRDVPLEVTFYDGEELLKESAVGGAKYWIVGDDHGTKTVVDRKEQLWSVDGETLPPRFINGSLALFILFLGIYRSQIPALAGATYEQAVRIVNSLRREFTQVDPLALAAVENWWSVVLEQVEQGLL